MSPTQTPKINEEENHKLSFPQGFLWGCATSHFQIEGFPDEIQNRLSDWANWTNDKSRIADQTSADEACQFYQRHLDDLALIEELGLKAFRISFNWPALMMGQKGQLADRLDENAVRYYKQFLAGLKRLDVKVFATLFHFTLPDWLSKDGGWLSDECPRQFARFAELVAREFGNDVDFWLTINEPLAYAYQGYVNGAWPPGIKNDYLSAFKSIRGQLKGHAVACKAIKSVLPEAKVSYTIHWRPFEPKNRFNPFDHFVVYLRNSVFNHLFPAAVRTGCLQFPFPLNLIGEVKKLEGKIDDLSDSCDFLAINYYTREISTYNLAAPANIFGERALNTSLTCNDMGWEVFPDGLYDVLVKESAVYQRGLDGRHLPVYITENGYASTHAADLGPGDWSLNDNQRVDYLRLHLEALYRAIKAGIDVRGYLYWSLLDNFEWAEGLAARFGLVRIVYPTQERKARASAHEFAKIARSNELVFEASDG
ncbi:hypothetical protein Lal_00015721 [Lupinus albus]|jgi:beta-glucosidase|nr:hypothetical protein Lal_00015721 [Lupinus albus]